MFGNGKTVQAHTITSAGLQYVGDSQDLAQLAEYWDEGDATGAFVVAVNGDYTEVWLTQSSRPYAADCLYTRVR